MSHCHAPSSSPAAAVAEEAVLAPADQLFEHGGAALQDLTAVHEADAVHCLVQAPLSAAALVSSMLLGMQPMLAAAPAAAALKHSCPGGALAGAACADAAAAVAAAGVLVEATAAFAGAQAAAHQALHAHAAAAAALTWLKIAMQQHIVHALPSAAHQLQWHAAWWI